MPPGADATLLLQRLSGGDAAAGDALLEVLYSELHSRASAQMRRQAPGHRLPPTALVNEAWLKLIQLDDPQWSDRTHFLKVSARAIDPSMAAIVELRFFGGRTMPETAECLGVSLSSAERTWRLAKAWLFRRLATREATLRKTTLESSSCPRASAARFASASSTCW